MDQDLDFVTKGLKVRGMVSFYNKTYAATYRSFSPYYYEMTDYTDNGDGTFDYNLQSIGTPGSSYLGTSTGRNGYREIALQGGRSNIRARSANTTSTPCSSTTRRRRSTISPPMMSTRCFLTASRVSPDVYLWV